MSCHGLFPTVCDGRVGGIERAACVGVFSVSRARAVLGDSRRAQGYKTKQEGVADKVGGGGCERHPRPISSLSFSLPQSINSAARAEAFRTKSLMVGPRPHPHVNFSFDSNPCLFPFHYGGGIRKDK